MKPINISDKNTEKINAALLAVNGRANSHTITSARQIRDIADAANDCLRDLGLSKARMVGAKVAFTSGGDVPNAYRRKRKVTRVHLERRKSGWFLNAIEAIEIWGNAPKTAYRLTCEQDRIACASGFRCFRSFYFAPKFPAPTAKCSPHNGYFFYEKNFNEFIVFF